MPPLTNPFDLTQGTSHTQQGTYTRFRLHALRDVQLPTLGLIEFCQTPLPPSWTKGSWWKAVVNGRMYSTAKTGLDSNSTKVVGAEPRCAAWQTWQAASFSPSAWVCARVWASTERHNKARATANAVTKPGLAVFLFSYRLQREAPITVGSVWKFPAVTSHASTAI